jgi:hypothetical protein
MTLVHKEGTRAIKPEKALFAARQSLVLLKEIEKSVTKRKRACILWQINLYSFPDRTVLEFSAANREDQITITTIVREAEKHAEPG